MRLGVVGLGRMGGGIARRLARAGHEVVAFDADPRQASALSAQPGITIVDALDRLPGLLAPARVVWVMVPAGHQTEEAIEDLAGELKAGDVIVDGGNSFYRDTIRRHASLRERGIELVDVGTSGGIWGERNGFSLMVGGEAHVVARLRPVLEALAPSPDRGWGHVGEPGAGHFVKMIHNAIEYALMQTYAEGFEILKAARAYELDLPQVARIWQEGSVIRSWLLELLGDILARPEDLEGVKPWVADSGEARWTVKECVDEGIPAPLISLSLFARFSTRRNEGFGARLLASLRNAFGGHEVPREEGGSRGRTAQEAGQP